MANDEQRSIISIPKNGTRLALIFFIINFLLVFANLYLSNGYISKTAYEADQRDRTQRQETLNMELREVAIELKGLNDGMQGTVKQDKRLDDLEARMRTQEQRR